MKKYKANAKVNIFLKITGTRKDYHTIVSRFMLVDNLFDTMYFQKKKKNGFELLGDFDCKLEQNTIYKAYKALLNYTGSQELKMLMQDYALKVEKNIPAFAGLGGGSSDAATYLKMCNEKLNLGLDKDTLAYIGTKIGADVAFFVYEYQSANVMGIGEIVEQVDEEPLQFLIKTPPIKISTPAVYKKYRQEFFAPIQKSEITTFLDTKSVDVLKNHSISTANDLYNPAKMLYPQLSKYEYKDSFFSGSGSSFFNMIV